MFYSCHTGCSLTNKKCVRASGRGGVRKATNMGALKTTSRQKRIGTKLGSHNCFPFSRTDLQYLAVPMAKVPPGEGFGAQKDPKMGADPGDEPLAPSLGRPPSLAQHELCWGFAGRDPVKGLYLGQFHIFEQIFQCGSTLGFRYLLKRSKRKWSSSIS